MTPSASGIKRRGQNLAVLHGENVGGSTFGNFSAFVEHDNFVETFLGSFRNGPNIVEPGDAFYAGERRSGVAAVLTNGEADNFAAFGERRGVDDQVDLRPLFVALPESHGVIDEIDTGAAVGDFIGANDFVEMDSDFGRGVGHGNTRDGGVFLEAAPVALVGKSFAARDAQGGKDAPATKESGLPGGEADLLHGEQAFVAKDVGVNQTTLTI